MDINMQKHKNYSEQNIRLAKAINNRFYLEAIFIEYSILEDRTEAILRYTNDIPKPRQEGRPVDIAPKVKKIMKVAENKKSIAHKYFTEDFMNEIKGWIYKRNSYIHALMKKDMTTEELREYAIEGQNLAKKLCTKSINYKRALERKNFLVTK